MSKKPKKMVRPLDVITREIGDALQSETANIIKTGGLLIEAKAQVKHKEWLPYLSGNFDLSLRTAQRYMAAAEWAASNTTPVSHLKLSPTVLYDLATGNYEPETASLIIETAKSEWVNDGRATAIVEQAMRDSLQLSEDDEEGMTTDENYLAREQELSKVAQRQDDLLKEKLSKAEQRQLEQKQLEDEANAILDGPPPDLPPTQEPVVLETDRYLHEKLAELMVELKKLTGKLTDRFAACEIEPSDLESAADFLRDIATKITRRKSCMNATNSDGGDAQFSRAVTVSTLALDSSGRLPLPDYIEPPKQIKQILLGDGRVITSPTEPKTAVVGT
jgi:hypothetical protein